MTPGAETGVQVSAGRTVRSIGLLLILALAGCGQPTQVSSAPASPVVVPSRGGLAKEQAIDVAREALREVGEDWALVAAESGVLAEITPGWAEEEWARGLSPELLVWRVVLAAGELSAEVVIDAANATVYRSVVGIAN
jgi:hypothetical protein